MNVLKSIIPSLRKRIFREGWQGAVLFTESVARSIGSTFLRPYADFFCFAPLAVPVDSNKGAQRRKSLFLPVDSLSVTFQRMHTQRKFYHGQLFRRGDVPERLPVFLVCSVRINRHRLVIVVRRQHSVTDHLPCIIPVGIKWRYIRPRAG